LLGLPAIPVMVQTAFGPAAAKPAAPAAAGAKPAAGASTGNGGNHRLGAAFQRAKVATKTSVIVMQVDAYEGWTTQGHAWWEIGTAEVSANARVTEKHAEVEAGRAAQRPGV
jgi:3D-(3,5/4)-trihydroxycyclohexane-1,2-dione acylhydrolase (decyclizing)